MVTRRFYIRDEKKNPVGCVVYTLGDGEVTFGVSCHNPKDKYDKSVMVTVAQGREQTHPDSIENVNKDERYRKVLRMIRMKIVTDRTYPHRLRNALESWRSTWDVD